jgi:hypothetical protein
MRSSRHQHGIPAGKYGIDAGNVGWAACGDPYLRGMEYHRKPFTPKPLEFAEPVTFDLENYSADKKRKFFGEPFFEIVNGKAVCKMGAYVDELYQINRDGVLKARGVGQ